ncbi:MAG: hypothetical protein V4739_06880 [Pseudomonadota bacterium]
MIPVFAPSIWLFALLGLGMAAPAVLVAWGLALAVSKSARAAHRRHWMLSTFGMVVLAVPAVLYALMQYELLRMRQAHAQTEQARRLTLAQPQSLDGIAMPTGTRLHMLLPNQPDSFEEAVFPSPTVVRGHPVQRLTRTVRHTGEAGGFRVHGLSLTLAGNAPAQVGSGWRCDPANPLEFNLDHDSGDMRFASCALAPGQQVDGVSLPAGAVLRASRGTLYLSGARDTDRWVVMPEDGPDKPPVVVQGVALRSVRLYFDAAHRLVHLSDGVLSEPVAWGALRYPAGTRVQTVPMFWRQRHPGSWIFSPVEPTPYANRPDVLPGQSVVQMPSGDVRAIVPNAQAGVLEFAKFKVN